MLSLRLSMFRVQFVKVTAIYRLEMPNTCYKRLDLKINDGFNYQTVVVKAGYIWLFTMTDEYKR